jgi:hypothetical protein
VDFETRIIERASFQTVTAYKSAPCLARRRSPALKPRKRHAEGVGLDGDAQRQAQRVQAVSADLIQHRPTGQVPSFTRQVDPFEARCRSSEAVFGHTVKRVELGVELFER